MTRVRSALAVTVCVLAVAVLVPTAPTRLGRLLAPDAAATAESALLDLIGLAGAALAAWLSVSAVALLVLDRLAPRTWAWHLARRLTPSAWRRIVLTAAGVAATVGATVPTAAPADVPPPPLTGLPLPDRPESARPSVPDRAPAPVARADPRPVVVVRPGDSLWRIAAHHLPAGAGDARIARAVRAWHRANARVVGPDPDLLHPGTRLRPPAQENHR